MQYSTAALIASYLLAAASAAPSTAPLGRRGYQTYQPKDYYQTYYPNSNNHQGYYPYIAAKPQLRNAYERQQEYDNAISASENENANSNENLAGAKSENANENANLAKGGEAFGFGCMDSDNRNLLATENNIEVANANKNELGVEVANFNANENTAQQESSALADVQNKDMALFEDFLENEDVNVNDNQNEKGGSNAGSSYRRPCNPGGRIGGRSRGY